MLSNMLLMNSKRRHRSVVPKLDSKLVEEAQRGRESRLCKEHEEYF